MRHLIKNQNYKQMPWKNGKGVTEEIIKVTNPPGGEFLWRLSIADIKENGEFSLFDGYQRIISVLEGEGMLLDVDGNMSRPLWVADPFAFSGNAKVKSTLLAGCVRDFNLIYDPTYIKVRLQWFKLDMLTRFFTDAEQLVVFSTVEGLMVEIADDSICLNRYDTVWSLPEEQGLYEVTMSSKESAASCCVIELYSLNIND